MAIHHHNVVRFEFESYVILAGNKAIDCETMNAF